MTTEVKRLIRVRVEKGASFKRDGFGKKRQLSDSWRKPRGQHNKQREQKKAKGALPTPGYGSPVAVRNMHPSGFFEVLVASLKELEGLDPKTQAIRIGATVGDRKRIAIQEKAGAAGIKVLNARTVKVEAKKPAKAAVKTEGKEKMEAKPSKTKSPSAPAKKESAKEKPAEKPAEKKAPAKAAKAEKSKAESTEKPAEKKAPAKAAKPAAEKDAEAKPKAAAKPKAKSAKSGVKKNE
jgi:large subunit ribosomal protein L32e